MSYLVFFYGVFILIGGIAGYAKAASVVSLVMGLVFGAFLLVAAGGMKTGKKWGGYLALVLTLILETSFTWRWVKTGQFVPPGLLSLTSFLVLILLAVHLQILTRKHLNK